MTKPISDRIQAALKGGKSEGVNALIQEAGAAAVQSRAASQAARHRALDPLLTDEQIAEARKDSEDALFTADRMDRAAEALREALTSFLAAEEEVRRSDRYGVTKARRDAIEAKFRNRYPALANEMGALLAEVAEAEREIAVVNTMLPRDGQHLMPIEPWDRRPTTIIRLPNVSPGLPMVWGPSDRIGEPNQYRPHPDSEAVCPCSASERTDESGEKPRLALSSVRLVPRDAGEAA